MLKSIRIFLKVAELSSFSQAGKVLSMAPSSIARSIDNLEAELKTTLFKRSTRQLRLTDQGMIFLNGANKLVADSDVLLLAVSGNSREPEGHLRISVFESFGRLHVCPIIPEFLRKYPNISMEIELENKVVDLSGGDIHLAIRIGTPADSNLKARTLLSNHTLVCASPNYLSKHSDIAQPADLTAHNCLLLNQSRQRTYWHFKKNRRQMKVPVQGNLKSTGGTPLLEAAMEGLGVVQLSNWVVSDFVKSGQLVVCLKNWVPSLNESTSGNVYAVYQRSTYPDPNIRLFIDYLVEKTHNKVLHHPL